MALTKMTVVGVGGHFFCGVVGVGFRVGSWGVGQCEGCGWVVGVCRLCCAFLGWGGWCCCWAVVIWARFGLAASGAERMICFRGPWVGFVGDLWGINLISF